MNILRWGRYMGDKLDFTGAVTIMVYGIRGAGKSTLLEHIGMGFMDRGDPIIDLFGSRSGEGLAWLRSPNIEGKKVLLLHGDNTDVASSFDSKPVSRYTVKDLDHYDLVISSSLLYSSIDEEYRQLNRVTDMIYTRTVWTKPCYVIIREAANLLYSRMKVSPDQNIAKAELTYLIREARHMGFSLALDSQKLSSIDIDIRQTIDHLFFKSLGIQGLPQDYHWLYKIYVPLKLQKMPENNFLLLTKTGSHGVGSFPYHDWHKRPGEDILKAVGIEIHHGEEMIQSKQDFRIGDLQHAEIVRMRNAGLSYPAIAEGQGGISLSTAYAHVTTHNKEVERLGECSKCKRAKSELSELLIGDSIAGRPLDPKIGTE